MLYFGQPIHFFDGVARLDSRRCIELHRGHQFTALLLYDGVVCADGYGRTIEEAVEDLEARADGGSGSG